MGCLRIDWLLLFVPSIALQINSRNHSSLHLWWWWNLQNYQKLMVIFLSSIDNIYRSSLSIDLCYLWLLFLFIFFIRLESSFPLLNIFVHSIYKPFSWRNLFHCFIVPILIIFAWRTIPSFWFLNSSIFRELSWSKMPYRLYLCPESAKEETSLDCS